MKVLVLSLLLISTRGLADEKTLEESVTSLAPLPLTQQAEIIKKKAKLSLIRTDRKGGIHYFEFLPTSKRTVDQVSNLEGLYGKVECPRAGSYPEILVTDDAPPATLIHQYIHLLQREKDPRWCQLEGRVLELPEKREQAILFHKQEFEALRLLYERWDKLNPGLEDRMIITEGLYHEDEVLTQNNLGGLSEKVRVALHRELETQRRDVNYLKWLSRNPDEAGSVSQKIEVLSLKNCAEKGSGRALNRVNECVEKRCKLSRWSCRNLTSDDVGTQDDDVLALTIAAWTKPNLILACPTQKLKEEFQDHLEEPTFCWKKWFSSHHHGHKEIKLAETKSDSLKHEFGAPSLQIDRHITYFMAPTPEVFLRQTYCYFIYQKTADYGSIPPDQFAYARTVATLETAELKLYSKWLDSPEGQTCGKLVKIFTGDEPDPHKLKSKNPFIMVVNPFGSLSGGVQTFKTLVATELNHERLHAIFDTDKKLRIRVKKEWQSLEASEKEAFKQKYSKYDFSQEDVLLREYFAFSRQANPRE